MKKFIMEKDFLEIFPDAKIGILVCNGIDNHIKDENRYADYLAEAQREAAKHITNPEFTERTRLSEHGVMPFTNSKPRKAPDAPLRRCSNVYPRAEKSDASTRWWTSITAFHLNTECL